MHILLQFFQTILHLDKYLTHVVSTYGEITYVIMFVILFAETGFVVTPFLPGDSLLFAAGALSSQGSLNIGILLLLLSIAAIAGDTINYWIGHFFGNKIIEKQNSKLIKREHIEKTKEFYKKYGGKTIILARFVPIVRTFAPFVAGIGSMNYKTFISYNVIGGIAWISLLTLAGFYFGNIPFIKANFHYAILAIIIISILPMVYEVIQSKQKKTSDNISMQSLKDIVEK